MNRTIAELKTVNRQAWINLISVVVVVAAIFFMWQYFVIGFNASMGARNLELTEQTKQDQIQIQTLQNQLNRDDQILETAFGSWNRSRALFTKEVTVTCYTSRACETDSDPHINASNNVVRLGTIAVSRDLKDLLGGFGAKVTLVGYGVFEVADVMNARFTNSVDIWMSDLQAAKLHGRQKTEMLWQTQ